MTSPLALGVLSAAAVALALAEPSARWPVRRISRRRLGTCGTPTRSRSRTTRPEMAVGRLARRTWLAPWRRRRVDHLLLARRCLDHLTRSARAGDALAPSLVRLVQDHPDLEPWFGAAARRCQRGLPLARALAEPPRHDPPQGMALLHHALSVAGHPDTGQAGAVRVLELSAVVAADRRAVADERRAQSAQARLSATVLTWLPLGVAGVSAMSDARVRHVLTGTTLGLTCLLVGATLAVGGQWWIRHIVDGEG